MTDANAERWVTVSALVVAGIYAYRRLTEQPASSPVSLKQIAGVGQLPPLGAWMTAWGFTFLVVAVIATAAPELGAAFAILIATGDLMTNAQSVFSDVGKQTGSTGTAAQTAAATAASNLVNVPGGGTAPYRPPTHLSNPGTPVDVLGGIGHRVVP